MEPIRIQKVIDYIEAHLTDELSYAWIAAMMAVSEADLQRSFKMITGMTISEYIRYRRLSSAAIDLKKQQQGAGCGLQLWVSNGGELQQSV